MNLEPGTVDELKARGYIVGQLPRTIFYEKNIKETDWTATDAVVGADGKMLGGSISTTSRKGSPRSTGWIPPSPRSGWSREMRSTPWARWVRACCGSMPMASSASRSVRTTAAPGPRGTLLSVTSNQLIAGLVRKLGGFTFQELNLTLDDIKAMSRGAPIIPPLRDPPQGDHHALVTGDAEFLRRMLRLQKTYQIDPAALIHALQNHDELTLELVEYIPRPADKDATFTLRGQPMKGSELREIIRVTRMAASSVRRRPTTSRPPMASLARPPPSSPPRSASVTSAASPMESVATSSAPTCSWPCTTPCSRVSSPCRAGNSWALSPFRPTP